MPLSGTLQIDSNGAREKLKKEWIPQDFRNALFPWKTVRSNLLPWRNTQFQDSISSDHFKLIVELLQIEPFLDRFPCDLSGGQQQRVMIGRVLLSNPDLLIMDEPFSAMDEETKLSLMNALRQYWQSRTPTVIVALHEPACAARLGDLIWAFRGPPLMLHSTIEHPDPIEAEKQIRQSLMLVE